MMDSLLTAGDTTEAMLLDSLFIQDSIEMAKASFEKWFNSLSRREKKKWKYEQELPAKMHRADSILHRKDSIKARKDSIIAATPRILDTYILPDSLQYKRLITWTHDRRFNDLELHKHDTSYNAHYNDFPFFQEDVNATHLGISGSAVEYYDFFKRKKVDGAEYYAPYESWTYSPETLPQYNTKTPYTQLCYWGTLFANSEKEESNVKIMTTQNILPEWNIHLEYRQWGGNGLLKNERTNNRTAVVSTNYLGKKYVVHAGYIHNKVIRNENGGIVDNSWIRDTLVDSREIDVHLANATNEYKKNTVYLDQTYRIPFPFKPKVGTRKERKAEKARRDSIYATGDSLAIIKYDEEAAKKQKEAAAKSKNEDYTTAFIGHASDYTVYSKFYQDNIGLSDKNGREFYNNNFFLNPTMSADSMRTMKFENKIFLRLQPWKDDAIVSKIDVGIGDKLMNYYNFNRMSFLNKQKNTVHNSLYVYAGVLGQYKKYLKWNVSGKYNFAGYEVNDFDIEANVNTSFYPFRRDKQSPLNFGIHFVTSLKEPEFYQQHLYMNHYKWDNNFKKTSDMKVSARLAIPKWGTDLNVGYALLNNYVYYDKFGTVNQHTAPISVFQASLQENFAIWKFHFDNQILFQYSTNKEVLPLPMVALNLRYYFQFNVVKNVMQMQIGAHTIYNTRWYAPAFNPSVGVFHNQETELYGNCANFDIFVNIQWKQACIFVKFQNVGMGKPSRSADYFAAHGYIRPQRGVKFGIHWPFYVRSKSAGKASGRGSAGGGNSRPSAGENMMPQGLRP